MLKRFKTSIFAVLLITTLSAPCYAADAGMRDVFENSLYGGLVGALVGTALIAFTHKPGDHLNYISIGAASGVLAGIGYSAMKNSRALVSIENGDFKLAIPTVKPELQTANSKGSVALLLKADLIRASF